MAGLEHVPVLLDAVLNGLRIREDGCYVDGTFGRGGHSRAILERLGPAGRLVAIDRDPQAIASASSAFSGDPRVALVKGELGELAAILGSRGVTGRVDGMLFDLGVSSPQLDEPARGFSFQSEGPLDMRMDPESGVPASEWLDNVDESELAKTLQRYGEERQARRIARAIVAARRAAPLETTRQLADVVAEAAPRRGSRIHPATRTFQAIRIAVNDELGQLERALAASLDALSAGGRLCVISFHSLEDRIVKRFVREHAREDERYRGMPEVPAEARPKLRAIGRGVAAGAAEIDANPRARSARLRIAERLA